ncbi:MAG: hypothetical protein AB1571_02530 [Nanoarchaeota archaeon]
MARVWYLGKKGLEKRYMIELSFANCLNVLGLNKDEYICSLKLMPRFKDVQKRAKARYRKYVIVELTGKDTDKTDFKPGYYLSGYKPREIFE